MAHSDNDVCTLFPHFRHIGARRFQDVARSDIAFKMLAVPIHDLWWHKPDKSDLDRMALAIAVLQHPVEDHVRLDQRVVFRWIAACVLNDVRRDHWEVRTRKRFHQEIKAIVELVVAKC